MRRLEPFTAGATGSLAHAWPLGHARPLALALVLTLTLARSSSAQDDGLPPPSLPKRTTAVARATPTEVTTSFDPRTDAPMFANNGDYASVAGDCFGMSLVAIDNFNQRMTTIGPMPPRASKVSELAADGDLKEEELAALLEADALKKDMNRAATPFAPSNAKPILAALARIQKSGTPEPFFTYGGSPMAMGHVTVLTGLKNGKLQFYDPDFPGETIEWPFDSKKGLGAHPKANDPVFGDFYGHLRSYGSAPFASLEASKDIGAIRAVVAAEQSGSTKSFPKVEVKLAPGTTPDEVELSGSVSRGLKSVNGEPTEAPARVWFKVNGTLVSPPTTLAPSGAFKTTLPRSLFTDTSEVVAVATTRPVAPDATEQGSLAGFSTQRLALPAPRSGFVPELEKAH